MAEWRSEPVLSSSNYGNGKPLRESSFLAGVGGARVGWRKKFLEDLSKGVSETIMVAGHRGWEVRLREIHPAVCPRDNFVLFKRGQGSWGDGSVSNVLSSQP